MSKTIQRIASDHDSKYRIVLKLLQNIYGLLQMFKSDCPSSASQKRYGFQPTNIANVSSSILQRVVYFLKEIMRALMNDLASIMIGGCSIISVLNSEESVQPFNKFISVTS